eukprot:1141346-Pelagomonas_calceolata.AAC.1
MLLRNTSSQLLVLEGQFKLVMHTYGIIVLCVKFDDGSWLALPPNARMEEITMDGTVFKPYICADSVFAYQLLCLNAMRPPIPQSSNSTLFNYALIWTRRVVE